jgi:hypothetical protein
VNVMAGRIYDTLRPAEAMGKRGQRKTKHSCGRVRRQRDGKSESEILRERLAQLRRRAEHAYLEKLDGKINEARLNPANSRALFRCSRITIRHTPRKQDEQLRRYVVGSRLNRADSIQFFEEPVASAAWR